MEATTKDLRLHTRELISATERGEQITITYRGKPRARLMPLESEPANKVREPNPTFALWADRDDAESVDEQVRRLRQPRKSP